MLQNENENAFGHNPKTKSHENLFILLRETHINKHEWHLQIEFMKYNEKWDSIMPTKHSNHALRGP